MSHTPRIYLFPYMYVLAMGILGQAATVRGLQIHSTVLRVTRINFGGSGGLESGGETKEIQHEVRFKNKKVFLI